MAQKHMKLAWYTFSLDDRHPPVGKKTAVLYVGSAIPQTTLGQDMRKGAHHVEADITQGACERSHNSDYGFTCHRAGVLPFLDGKTGLK
jgi:hypothetical protein